MKVQQMTSPRTGRAVANQFIIRTDDATYLQSYNSIIVKSAIEDGKQVIYLDERFWNYSVTTSKHRNEFLGENTKETRKKIASGEYKLTDLNKS